MQQQTGLCGGLHKTDASHDHQHLVDQNLAKINSKLGTHATKFTINSVQTQVVAGTNYFFHLTSNDNHKYTVTIFVPLPYTGQPAQVTDGAQGHN